MSLSIGIVGLPNVGKSTLFNALTRAQNAVAANYPFSTIESNHAVVALPDERLTRLQAWVGVQQAINARVDFVDVAGLVKGAHKGEGLGNRFLGHIRHVDAIVHVVRCFDDENVAHVNAQPHPADDIQVINTELALADLQQLERRLEKLEREVKGDRSRCNRSWRWRNRSKRISAPASRCGISTGASSLTSPLSILRCVS